MAERIVFADGTIFQCPATRRPAVSPFLAERPWKRITVTATVEEARGAFADGAEYTRQWDSGVYLEDGTYASEIMTEDLSEYCVAGDIIDTRDGSVTVYMGRKTDLELLREQLAEQTAAMAVVLGEAE